MSETPEIPSTQSAVPQPAASAEPATEEQPIAPINLPDAASAPADVAAVASMGMGLTLAAGIAGAVGGAVLWWLVARLFDYQVGYVAILIGLMVGFGMKFTLRGAHSLPLGVVAALLAAGGLLLGSYLIWYLDVPAWTRESVAEIYNVSLAEVEAEISDADVRTEYPFGEYLSDELTDPDSEPYITWLFYGLALYTGFSQVSGIGWRRR